MGAWRNTTITLAALIALAGCSIDAPFGEPGGTGTGTGGAPADDDDGSTTVGSGGTTASAGSGGMGTTTTGGGGGDPDSWVSCFPQSSFFGGDFLSQVDVFIDFDAETCAAMPGPASHHHLVVSAYPEWFAAEGNGFEVTSFSFGVLDYDDNWYRLYGLPTNTPIEMGLRRHKDDSEVVMRFTISTPQDGIYTELYDVQALW